MVYRALILALALRITISLNSTGVIVPLFQNGLIDVFRAFLPVSALMISLVYARRGEHPLMFIYMAILGICTWVFNYSAATAFFPHVILLCFFALVSFGLDEKRLKFASALFFSLTFIASAVFKLNGSFLGGSEFSDRSDFLIFLRNTVDVTGLRPYSSMLAWLTIAGELFLGIFIWIRPLLTIHCSLLLFIILSFVHPPVIFVYFCYLTFYFVFSRKEETIFKNPFFWLVLIVLSSMIFGLEINVTTVSLSLLLLVFQVWLMVKSDRTDEKPEWTTSWKAFAPGVLIVLTCIMRVLGAPSPLGYSMFSSTISKPELILQTSQFEVCSYLGRNLRRTIVSDVRFIWYPGSPQCSVLLPTQDSASYLKHHLCGNFPMETCQSLIVKGPERGK